MAEPSSLAFNNVHLQGKITNVRNYENKFYTQLITPAADSYSKPSSFEVSSTSQIGTIGQEVKMLCSLSGYISTFQYPDKGNPAIKHTGFKSQCYLTLIKTF